jgi:NADH-quinone oxidoreductase subunit A
MIIFSRVVEEFLSLSISIIFCIIVSIFLLIISSVVSGSKPNVEKLSTYEYRFEPYEDAINLFDVNFYLVAILFIIFDSEAVFILPWCISFSSLTNNGYLFMIDFIVELLVGFLYAWRLGIFGWEDE